MVQDHSVWQPGTWVELLQVIVNILAKLMSRSSILPKGKLADTQSHVSQLQQAFHAFQPKGSLAGENILSSSLSKLARYILAVANLPQCHTLVLYPTHGSLLTDKIHIIPIFNSNACC